MPRPASSTLSRGAVSGSSVSLEVYFLLIIIALVGGVCITTIGPGGIFVTIALFALAKLEPSTVAGTASAMFIATGVVGSLAYLRSGELRQPGAAGAATSLSLSSVLGALGGAQLNTLLDARVFGILLGAFVLLTGLLIPLRQRLGRVDGRQMALAHTSTAWLMGAVGLGVGFFGGLLGVGGPVLAVPILVVLGVPMLVSVALAQVQSVVIAAFATAGFLWHGAIDWMLALILGVPLVVGSVAGWYIARRVDVARLQLALAAVLLGLGVYLLSVNAG